MTGGFRLTKVLQKAENFRPTTDLHMMEESFQKAADFRMVKNPLKTEDFEMAEGFQKTKDNQIDSEMHPQNFPLYNCFGD